MFIQQFTGESHKPQAASRIEFPAQSDSISERLDEPRIAEKLFDEGLDLWWSIR